MTKITLSTGDKYTIEAPAAEIIQAMNRDRWISLEDSGRDIRVRSSHIVAIEEDTAAIVKEAVNHTVKYDECRICGKKLGPLDYFENPYTKERYCKDCPAQINTRPMYRER